MKAEDAGRAQPLIVHFCIRCPFHEWSGTHRCRHPSADEMQGWDVGTGNIPLPAGRPPACCPLRVRPILVQGAKGARR